MVRKKLGELGPARRVSVDPENAGSEIADPIAAAQAAKLQKRGKAALHLSVCCIFFTASYALPCSAEEQLKAAASAAARAAAPNITTAFFDLIPSKPQGPAKQGTGRNPYNKRAQR